MVEDEEEEKKTEKKNKTEEGGAGAGLTLHGGAGVLGLLGLSVLDGSLAVG